MDSLTEPVIVTVTSPNREPRRAFLADVLIVVPDHHTASERYADLFIRFPGLAVVVIADGMGAIDAGFRDGAALTLEFHLLLLHLALRLLLLDFLVLHLIADEPTTQGTESATD